jgi:hypothetical protein
MPIAQGEDSPPTWKKKFETIKKELSATQRILSQQAATIKLLTVIDFFYFLFSYEEDDYFVL